MRHKQKGSILIFVTWILLIMSLFAISVGVRSRLGIGLSGIESRYLTDSYTMHSAVNLAAYFLNEDEDPMNDWKKDKWFGSPAALQKLPLSKEVKIEITDEESKINLNVLTAQNSVILDNLFLILNKEGVKLETDPKKLAGSILAWMGKSSADSHPSIGFDNKKARFESVDELALIESITPHDFEVLRPFFTVYGQNRFNQQLRINLNTVNPWVLKAIIQSLSGGESDKTHLFEQIERYRNGDPQDSKAHPPLPFVQEDLATGIFMQKLMLSNSIEMTNTVTQFLSLFATTDSQFFFVRVETKREGYTYPRVVEAVLGFRQPVLVQVTRGNYNLEQRLNNVLNGYPYEILYWNERI